MWLHQLSHQILIFLNSLAWLTSSNKIISSLVYFCSNLTLICKHTSRPVRSPTNHQHHRPLDVLLYTC